MASPTNVSDEPLSPSDRLFLRPEMNTIIHCAIGVKNFMDVDAIKSAITNSILVQYPRFCSLLVHDKNGLEHWRRTTVDIDKHIIFVDTPAVATTGNNAIGDAEKRVNDYIADLSVSSPLSTDKPLWEIHIMWEQRCAIFRFHHALGDGIELMSLLVGSCRKVEDPDAVPTVDTGSRKNWRGWEGKDWRGILMELLKMVLFNLVFCLEMVLRSLWVGDRKTVISGGEGVELWPRKVATAHFLMEDMKVVKKAITNATINDVLLGVISDGLSKYLEHRSPNSLQENQRVTGLAMVNLREQLGLQDMRKMMESEPRRHKGNKFGIILLPVYYNKGIEPLQHVMRAKAIIDSKKLTLEAHISYKVADLAISFLGSKFVSYFNYRIHCNCSFTISNVVGPKEESTIAGNPITYLRVTTTGLPQALAMHMVSYAGRADMQIVVAKDIISDPQFLAKCFEDSLLHMKEAATATATTPIN